ncbi:hypothetical protein LL273_09285 [Marinobacter salarius]|uniref:hypothetical protein n=1 Tax=Marinobacter salarius TaxID=1420917 RepID=UPI001D186E1E|nr:hypothetical protein [Marinobacter salarius]MCC4283919.1 hypothetical protein [Marinobacter salarius]
MSKVIKAVFGVLLVLVVIAIGGLAAVWLSFDDMCGNQVESEIWAPNRANKVVIFQRDCGATTGFSTQLSILASGEELHSDDAGNFYIETGHPKNSGIEVEWLGPKSVLIKGATRPLRATEIGDIKIVSE